MNKSSFCILGLATIALLGIASCSDTNCEAVLPQQERLLTLDGASDYINLSNAEQTCWQIEDCPEWITPAAKQGTASDSIRLYVESNGRTPLRQGNITVRYANGQTHTTRATQNNLVYMRRSFATGWGFDVRTYSDSRGLRDQIFNIQRIQNDNKNMYCSTTSKSTDVNFYYGSDASDLQNDIQAKLDISGKAKTFSLDLNANFGMTAINNSKRIFSWIRGVYSVLTVYLNNPDRYSDILGRDWFTADFKAMRQEVIDSQGSDATISRLVNNYGTHYVEVAVLGGCYDYYYSSVYDNSDSKIDVEATLNFAYAKKFNFKGSADLSNDLSKMSNEVIEKFSVKGGDNVDLTNKVFAGTITQDDTNAWLETLNDDNKLELLDFTLSPISELFPDNIAEKIEDYMERLYYSEIPVTRNAKDNQ